MNVKSYYKEVGCKKAADYDNLVYQKGRYSILSSALRMLALKWNARERGILHSIYEYLLEEYKKADFPLIWQSEVLSKDDTMKVKRVLDYLKQFSPVSCMEHVAVNVSRALPDGSCVLEETIPLVVRDANGCYCAILLHAGKCVHGLRGRSIATRGDMQLAPMVAKLGLESKYPGIRIVEIFCTHRDDLPGATGESLEVSDKASTNVLSLSYDTKTLREDLERVLSAPSAKECNSCAHEAICKAAVLTIRSETSDSVGDSFEGNETETGYKLPEFTEDQRRVVFHKDGALRVCAGPGSGKTATLVGRVRYLVEECGVPPQFILLLTFTNKARDEILARCRGFLPEHELPTVKTINGLAFSILREQEGEECTLKVLTDEEQLRIVRAILGVWPEPIKGMKTDMLYGDTGLYATVLRRIKEFNTVGIEEYFAKYGECEDIEQLAEMYNAVIEAGNYLTFDDQVTMCNWILEDQEVLSIYQHIYKYIMVDEFQDVNAEQWAMISAIAKGHGNIVVVGDDDQNLYAFRGADVGIFLNQFGESFPSQTVVLRKNFRGTKELVDSSRAVIEKAGERVSKELCGEGSGLKPQVVKSTDAEKINKVIFSLLESGYKCGDIAVLAWKNKTLDELKGRLSVPCVLAKNYLRYDSFFLLTRAVLNLSYNLADNASFMQFAALFGKSHLLSAGGSLYEGAAANGLFQEEMRLLHGMLELWNAQVSVEDFLLALCQYVEPGGSLDALAERVNQGCITSLAALRTLLNEIYDFEEKSRIDIDDSDDKVTLVTCHDAKGKEWPVVLLVNDFNSVSDEARRMFYVAVTRPKKILYLFENEGYKASFLADYPHEVIEI